MGTRGFVVFKYKGIYYVFYNNSDSYLEHLCNVMINDIKEMIARNNIKFIKNKILAMPLEENEDYEGEENYYPGLKDAIIDPTCFCYNTTKIEPSNNVFIEYIYMIDFDNELFIIKMRNLKLQFDIFNLPENLIEIAEKHEELHNQDDYDNTPQEIISIL
jgi:hypothetical protein